MTQPDNIRVRLLLLSQWYLPEPQKVVSDLAESLREEGFDVTVLTGFPNYPEGRVYDGYRGRLWMRETLNGVPVIRVPLYADHSRSPIRRVLNFVSFALSAAFIGFWLTPRADVIYVVHPPLTTAFPAWLFSKLWRKPFVYEIQDMWPETLRATGLVNSERVLGLVGWFAQRVYRRALGIRVISPGFKENLIAKGVPEAKIAVHSNWVDTQFYYPAKAEPERAQSLGLSGHFNVMYAGAIGLAQGLETVLEAAETLNDTPSAQFVLVGDGADAERLRKQIVAKKLTNVRMLGRYPGEEMSQLYALADVLLIHLKDDPLFRITIPHKTFSYMAAGKPILAAVAGDTAKVVAEARAGVTCAPGDAKALADAVREMSSYSREQLASLGANGRKAACDRYSREAITSKIACWLRRLLQDSRPSGRSVRASTSQPQSWNISSTNEAA
jgi:colanic acid biosynthesis glycosyl transferase WcaI